MYHSQLHNQHIYYPQAMLLAHFEWQLDHRAKLGGGIAMSINMSLLVGAAAFIEATTKNFLMAHIQDVKAQNASSPDALTLFDALLTATHEKLLGAQWGKLVEEYTSIIGRRPTLDQEEEETIQNLFTFRNELVHGKQIHATVTIPDGKVSYHHKYQGVVNHLIKRKVLDKQLLLDSNGSALLSNQVTDYFLGKALAFAYNLLDNAGDVGLPARNHLSVNIFWLYAVPHLRGLLLDNGVNVAFDHADAAGNPLDNVVSPNLPIY